MHILLIADGRSPITRRWVIGLKTLQHRVTLVSTFPCTPPERIEALHVLPVAFGMLGGNQIEGIGRQTDQSLRQFIGAFSWVVSFHALFAWAAERCRCITGNSPGW